MELIGRTREIADVVQRLRDRRLVTLMGPAGIGKTALARRVMGDIAGDFEFGAFFVDLTRVDDPQDVPGALAGQLGFATFDALVNSPSEQPALVVVDNCEHVTAVAADAIADLLASCDSPRVLATSRSPLDLPGESLVVLGPLGLPPPGSADGDTDAVRLFLDRTRDAGSAIADDQLDAVALLCRQLDGVPLALELAAAQTRAMPPGEILERLREGTDVLVRARFRGPDRHRSLTGMVQWSYRLLPPAAVALLDRLGVCAGPFTAALAASLGGDAGLGPDEAADALRLLVDSSLVVADTSAEVTRFRLPESVRMFALRQLRESGRYDEACGLLVDHVVAAAADEFAGIRRWDGGSFVRMLGMYDNAVAALRWCLAHDRTGDRALTLCALLWGVVHQGHTDEIAVLCDETLARWPDPAAPQAADAIATAATARFLVGDPDGALGLARTALDSAGASSTAPVLLRRAMAYAACATGDRSAAERLFAAVADGARNGGLLALALEADVNRAQLLADAGDLSAGRALASAARAEAIRADSPINEVWARSILAQFDLRADGATDPDTAGLAAVSAALDAARRLHYSAAIAVNMRTLAWGLIRAGRYPEAARTLLGLVDHVLSGGGIADLRGALLTAAELLHAVGDPGWPVLAATAWSLPPTGPVGSALDALAAIPPSDATPIERRDAIILVRRALRAQLAAPADPPGTRPAQSGRAAADLARLADRGQYWEVEFAGRVAHLKPSKGMSDIARLLSSPERELHCLELMGAAVEEPTTGDLLDRSARLQYEQRIRDLQAEVDAARADHDRGRADRAELEMDALVDHLTAALGLAGRGRRSGGSAERARSAVTQRIRSTIRAVRAAHPEFARHLEASVSTGSYCAYRPERPVDWRR